MADHELDGRNQSGKSPFGGVSCAFEMVPPAKALAWLGKLSRLQRHPSKAHVDALAAIMAAGGWRVTPAAVAFDHEGELIDGQHRLAAAIKAGVTIPLLVVRGVDPDVFDVIDQNRPRRPADLWPGSQDEGKYLEAVARISISRESGRGLYGISTFITSHKPTTHVVLARMHERKEEFLWALKQAARAQNVFKYKPIMAYLLLDFSLFDSDKAEEFVEGIASGAMLPARSPIKVMRERMLAARHTTDRAKELNRIDHAVMLIKAWNAFATGQEVSKLAARLQPNEPFPQPKKRGDIPMSPAPRVQKSTATHAAAL